MYNYFRAPDLPISLYTGVPLLEKAEVQRSNNQFTSLLLTIKASSPCATDVNGYQIFQRNITFGLSCQVSYTLHSVYTCSKCIFIAKVHLQQKYTYSKSISTANV